MGKKNIFQIPGELAYFDLDVLATEYQTLEELIESFRHPDVFRYRTRTIRARNLLELEIFPIWKSQEATRAKERKPSRTAQEKLNYSNTKKKIMRLANVNFDDSDLWGTFGFDDEHLPATPKDARKFVQNFIKRLKRRRDKYELPTLRYIYVIEWGQSSAGDIRCHCHIIMSGDMDRDEIEGLWKGGAYPQTRRLRAKEDCGLNGLAAYIYKGARNEKMWGHSTHLKQPKESVADHKITPRQAEKIASDENAAPAFFEKACKGYTFKAMKIYRSSYVAGAYIYVQMYKRKA